jgi:hypothetical protein
MGKLVAAAQELLLDERGLTMEQSPREPGSVAQPPRIGFPSWDWTTASDIFGRLESL